MGCDSDDDYERVSDCSMSGSEDEPDEKNNTTPGSTPPTRPLRPSDQKTIQCPYDTCSKTFNRQARLTEHLRSHTNDRVFKCPHSPCTKDYLRETHLQLHIKSAHSNVRDYSCTWPGCDQKFATGTRLRRHLEVHQGREKYRCRGYEGCNETFRKRETLHKHIAIVHEKRKPYPCPDNDSRTGQKCAKGFDTAEKLRQHQRVNHDPNRYSCSECLAHNASVMAEHHEPESRNFIKAFFATYAELQDHMAEYHPPTCPYCPTSFTTAKELARHLELQHEIKPAKTSKAGTEHKCIYTGCHKTFSKKGNLDVHIRTTHQNRKDFICGQTEITLTEDVAPGTVVHGCGRSFTVKQGLEDHVRTAHLGLESRQTERKKKRKAEDGDEDGIKKAKPRAPRKDKGVKKKSTVADLTGLAFVNRAAPTHADIGPIDEIDVPADASDDDLDYEGLSGSVTMLGSRVFHRTGSFDYTDGQYPHGLRAPDPSEFSDSHDHLNYGAMDYEEDDGFFGNFESEPFALDPHLLHA